MITRPSTFLEIMTLAKQYLVDEEVVGEAAVVLTASIPDSPPLHATGDVVVAISPSPEWQRDLGVYGENSDITLTGQLIISVWVNRDPVELLGAGTSLITGTTLGSNSTINSIIRLFSNDENTDEVNLAAFLATEAETQEDCDPLVAVSGYTKSATCYETPLMDSLWLESISMPQKQDGITRSGYNISFHCRFQLDKG